MSRVILWPGPGSVIVSLEVCTRVVAARIAFAGAGRAVVGKDGDGHRNARRVEADHMDQHGGQDQETHVELLSLNDVMATWHWQLRGMCIYDVCIEGGGS